MNALIVAGAKPESGELRAALSRAGFKPLVCDASAARERAAGGGYPLIVANSRGALVDDLELCRQLRTTESRPRPLLLLVTNKRPASELAQLLKAGADNFIVDQGQIEVDLQIAALRIQDRMESAQAEAELRASNERFQLAVSGANDGLWDAQPIGENWYNPETHVWYSPRCKQLLGLEDHELPNVLGSWETRLHPDDHDRIIAALRSHLEQRTPYDVEYRLRTKSGEFKWFSARGQAIWDDSGRPIRMAGSLRDISQSKQDREQLAESEEKWKSLVSNAPDIIIHASLDGTIRSINRETPYAQASLNRSLMDYVDEPFKPVLRSALAAVASTGRPQQFEVHGQTEHGIGTLWYANRMGPVYRDGRVESVVLIGTDITDRKDADERLKRERKTLRRLLELQERERQLVAYEIHDGLVQYLTAGLMHLEAFANSNRSPEEAQVDYETGTKLLREGLSEARRLISGLRPPILDEQGIVAALEYLVNEASDGEVEIAYVNRTSFSRLAAPLEVALFRITQEALTNIRKHSHAKKARVELVQHGDFVRLLIRDDGRGFDPKTVHEERFGLQGIRQRARLLGTTAVIDSAPSKGTTLVVDFPVLPATAPANI